MRLKGLENRAYNIMHHAHTVTGMMISLVLFIIFYAGAYSLFMDEIYLWENPDARTATAKNVDYDRVIQSITQSYELDMHDPVYIYPSKVGHSEVEFYASVKNTDGTHDHIQGHIDPESYHVEVEGQGSVSSQTTVSQTLYELHYLAQIPTLGMYISGFVALFFLLATITGVLIHWRNIFQKFYAFFVGKRWKQIWTDAHTVVGVISLPFQVMYAITGALFCLSILLLLPSVMVMFGGSATPVYSVIQPSYGIEADEDAPHAEMVSLNELKSTVANNYPEHDLLRITLVNYGREDAVASFEVDDHQGLMGSGNMSFQLTNGDFLKASSHLPYKKSYGEAVYSIFIKLHFGSFGGVLLRIIYFLLALLTCFMIISGILIWQVARDKNSYTEKERRFHHRITKLNLTVCLSLFPAIAILFIANKVIPLDVDGRGIMVEMIFFVSWLVLSTVGWFWDQYSEMTRNYFLLGGALSFLIPILNGLITSDWIWNSWREVPAVAGIDLLWLISGIAAIWGAREIKTQNQTEPEPALVR